MARTLSVGLRHDPRLQERNVDLPDLGIDSHRPRAPFASPDASRRCQTAAKLQQYRCAGESMTYNCVLYDQDLLDIWLGK